MNAIGLTVYKTLCAIAGALSDRHGRRRLNLISTVGYIILPLPAFWMMSNGSAVVFTMALALIAGSVQYIGTGLVSSTAIETPPSWCLISLAVIALLFPWWWLPGAACRDITAIHRADDARKLRTTTTGANT